MPVSDALAFDLLRAFAHLEFRLKQDSGFLTAGPYRMAKVDWAAVITAAMQLPSREFVKQVSDATRAKILTAERNRPMIQEVEIIEGLKRVTFKRLALSASDAGALIEAARRVRNNLFHGGKEEPHLGDDDDWAAAALDVTSTLLHLIAIGRLQSPEAP